jgi:hypothetical protein
MTTSFDFDPSKYLTPAQLVERWKNTPLAISYVTLARRRSAGKGPVACYAGHNHRVYYGLETIEAYEKSLEPHAKPQRESVQERSEGEGQPA